MYTLKRKYKQNKSVKVFTQLLHTQSPPLPQNHDIRVCPHGVDSGPSWALVMQHFFFFFSFIFISWRLITLQYCSGFCHTLTWISHGFTCVRSRSPSPTCLPIRSLWVFPVHQPWALVSCIQLGLVICFTLDSILVSMLFSQNIPLSPSPTESQSLFCTSMNSLTLLVGMQTSIDTMENSVEIP